MNRSLIALLALPVVALANEGTALDVPLEDKPSRTFAWQLPAETWSPVSGSFPIAHSGGSGFAVERAGDALLVDCDGDGTAERRIEGRENPDTKVTHAFVVLEGERVDGAALRYGIRLKRQSKGWQWSTATAAVGKVQGEDGKSTKIAVIDQDGDGVYGEIGQDALALGSAKVCTFLSESVHVGDQLYRLSVAADGTSLTLAPFDGPTGTLDARAELETDGKLLSTIVRSLDGKHSFDLARKREGITVPAGTYSMYRGSLGLGGSVVTIEPGRMKPITVKAGAEQVVTWGGPALAEFDFHREGGKLEIRPDEVWYYGAAGEEYSDWDPVGKSPEFTVKERKAGTELAKALFPGSC